MPDHVKRAPRLVALFNQLHGRSAPAVATVECVFLHFCEYHVLEAHSEPPGPAT